MLANIFHQLKRKSSGAAPWSQPSVARPGQTRFRSGSPVPTGRKDQELLAPHGESSPLAPSSGLCIARFRPGDGDHVAAPEPSAGLKQRSSGPPEQAPLSEGDPEYVLHLPVQDIDSRDMNTPDNWVARNPTLIRLTGDHPMNAGPPMSMLIENFITPVSLHYVRSHGLVPHIKWEEHQIVVDGLVSRPITLTMEHLVSLPHHKRVVSSMACARLRRKEFNVVKKTLGYPGGPQAVSTAEWTGVLLRDLLELAGIRSWEDGAHWIQVGGPKGEVTAGGCQGKGDTTYTTTLPYHQVMDAANEVLVAFMHNGRLLTPDHGYPVRLIVPGNIGGRSVKWLSSIHVSKDDTLNYYHLHDNRLFPPHIASTEQAEEEGLLTHPGFACREQNINSAIIYPVHGSEVPYHDDAEDGGGTITFKGYALTGGGREVIRVELSLDGGDTWGQAQMKHRALPSVTEGGCKYWTWVLWEWTVPTQEIAGKEGCEVRVRAFDSSMNTQPEHATWNLIGMMNNAHYVIKVERVNGKGGSIVAKESGAKVLRFLHPAPVDASDVRGWLEEEDAKKKETVGFDAVLRDEMENEKAAGKSWEQLKEIDMEEVARHTSKGIGVWFVRDGKVYDPTPFLNDHPGGAHIIESNAGKDASEVFNSIHSGEARKMTVSFLIGKVKGAPDPYQDVRKALAKGVPPPTPSAPPKVPDDQALSPYEARPFTLVKKENVSHDTRRFRFAFPPGKTRLGLPVGQHIQMIADVGGKQVVRPYTPVTLEKEGGTEVEFVIKVYEPHDNVPGGKMSMYVDGLQPGDVVSMRGPNGHVLYEGGGQLKWKVAGQSQDERVRRINMVGGGTGITPLYQVVKSILSDPSDPTELNLIYGNRTENDILLREDLERFAAKDKKFKVFFTLDAPPEPWTGGRGRVTLDMMKEHLYPAGRGCVAMVCGPPGMIEKAVKPALHELGFEECDVVDFDEGHR